MPRRRRHIVTIVGTRPEVIKMAPVVHRLENLDNVFEHTLVTTAQHREMLDQVLMAFQLKPRVDLGLMEDDQSLAQFTSRALSSVSNLLAELRPDAILVQGDTSTVMASALAAFYQNIPVGHVEAGLRTFDNRNPFPEEINRKLAGALATYHFAPTKRARANLLAEGVDPNRIFVTGNTIVDALTGMKISDDFDDPQLAEFLLDHARLVLVTAHRRENHGARLRSICRALRALVERFHDVEVIYPVHLNPNVRSVVREEIGAIDRIHLVEPAGYEDLLRLMKRSYLVLTDSGGIQEEAPSFHKPVLVMREVTERPELIEAGGGKIVGTSEEVILREAARLLTDNVEYDRMSSIENPFGDGRAAIRIADILESSIQRSRD